jgi:hypothetical protein
MNPRVAAFAASAIIVALGILGLIYPERTLAFLGFQVLNASHAAAALGEVRATYGGIFIVMGLFALRAALDPSAYRPRLRFIGLLWLGACAGRLLGAWIDGNPGLFGWATAAFEFVIGGVLVIAALSAQPAPLEAPVAAVPVTAPPS